MIAASTPTLQNGRMRGRAPRGRYGSAWIALTAGATSAALVIVLLGHTINGPDGETVRALLAAMALSALVALVSAIPALRHRRTRPIAMEGVELASVSLLILALLAFFFYVILGRGYS